MCRLNFLDGTVDGSKALPVDFSVARDEGTYRWAGVGLRFSPVPPADLEVVGGFALTSPRRTAFDLARWSRTEARALAMLDLSVRHDLVSKETFADYVAPLKRLHGLRRVFLALPEMCGEASRCPRASCAGTGS